MLLVLASAAAVAAMQSLPPTVGQPIVVTGQRINDLKASLRDCLARNCPTDQDIDATLALAESQIIAGDYREARETLVRSLRRNKDEARRYPIPVSDLYRANGKVAAHLGVDDDYYRSTWGIYRTLKEGLPSAEDRQFSALMEVAEMTARTRGHERARLYYDSIAKQAREADRPDIAAIAELRSAIRHLPPGSVWQIDEINRIAALEGPEMRAPKLEATLALARMAYEKNDEQGAQRALRNLAGLSIKRPMLIYVPAFDVRGGQTGRSEAGGLAGRMSGASFTPGATTDEGGRAGAAHSRAGVSATHHMGINVEDEWIDVGFNITPEGRVADFKVLRSRGDLAWSPQLLESIRGRRYTPGKAGDPMSVRRERYTYTSGLQFGAASRTATHSPDARIEYLDLSPMGIAEPS